MKIQTVRRKLFVILAISPLLLLSGCSPVDWFKDKCGMGTHKKTKTKMKSKTKSKKSKRGYKSAAGDWVVKVGDEVVISSTDFEQELNQLLEDRPQLKQMAALMPNLAADFARGLGNQEVIARDIQKKGIDQTAEYQEKKDRMLRAVDQMLNAEFFTKEMEAIQLTDADLTKFYEENKDTMQGILISRGGTKTVGVSFDKKTDAESFLLKARARKFPELQKFAKESGLKARDFSLVNGQSFDVDPVLRTKIMGIKKFPTVDMIAVNNKKFWVVHAMEKQENKYRSFEEIKDGIRNVAEQAQKGKQVQSELEKLTKNYGVQVNESYLQNRKKTQLVAGNKALDKKSMQITPEQLTVALAAQQKSEQVSESKAV